MAETFNRRALPASGFSCRALAPVPEPVPGAEAGTAAGTESP